MRVLVPRAGDDEYVPAIDRELARADYLAVLPASDAALVALQASGAQLVSKREVSFRAARAGLQTLSDRYFFTREELSASAHGLTFPVVVKPTVRTADSALVQRVDSAADLRRSSVLPPLVVQPWVDAPMTAVSGVVWQGALHAVVHQRNERLWPPEVGTSCWAVTTTGDQELENRLIQVLGDHEGVFQAQFLGQYLIDVNPRVYGSLPLAVAAGANLPGIYADLLRGERRTLVRARPGVRYRWLEGDLRHAWCSWRTAQVSPIRALSRVRPRRRTAHSTESWSDPWPQLIRVAAALRRSALASTRE